jgi:nucleoside-diphosphate-sugar epimerase
MGNFSHELTRKYPVKVLILGGTGSIGASVVRALVARRHEVIGLARSDSAADSLRAQCARPVRGDIRRPEGWIDVATSVDAVIQVAGDFTADADCVGRNLLSALLLRLQSRNDGPPAAYIYTGGCWLYGNTGDRVATEESPFDAPAEWAWSIDHLRAVLDAPRVRGIVIHPAMVYERDGGVLAMFRDDLSRFGRIRIFGHENVRWPMVHREDIGELYALALEQAPPGASYNGAAVDGIPVAALARAMARRAGIASTPLVRQIEEAVAEVGEWVRGYAIDQRMSGEKARRELRWSPTHTDPIADIS